MHIESFIINCNTLLNVSTLLGHLQGELSVALPRQLKPGQQSSRLQKQRSTQSTAHSHSAIKCNLSVTTTESSPWRWPGRVETCRSVLQLMIKLSLCVCWWLVFFVSTRLFIDIASRSRSYSATCSDQDLVIFRPFHCIKLIAVAY
jgi:hypothetical protein